LLAKLITSFSEDRDLLDIEEYQGIKIVDVGMFLKTLEEGESH
jgi:hypothetical protein